jgi:streptogramin lyase
MHVPRLSSITSAIAHLAVVPFLSFLIIATSAATPDTRPTGEPIAKLQPGKESGTFHLIYHTNAVFSVQGQCPLKVGISDLLHHEFTPTHMAGSGPFTVELDLRPGTYQLIVLPADPEKADYWPSDWQRLHIDKQGLLYRPRGWLSQSLDFVLDRRIRCMPDDLAIADTRQPMLKWPKVNGAAHYRGSFMTDKQTRDQFDVEETQYVIGGGISPGEWCYWSVTALDASGKTLARGEGRFYGHETDPALIAQVRAEAAACAVDPPSGQPYLGFQPIGTQVPKDPATPLPGPDSHMVMDFSSGFIPGVQVMEVLPGSPALDAGLVPDDVVIAIDGKRIPSDPGMNLGDARAFVAQISAIQPGTNVVLTVRRFPRELLLHATIGRFGMPTGSVAATTMPAPPAAIALAAAAANTDGTWTNVDAGKPAEFAFRPQPGVEHLRLSTAEGLGGDDVGTIAELSERRMAFGSRGGLSIWDGSRIRTFTGPSYSPRGGQSNGNSGLPSNDIQDLLFDKRGRLWVATSFGVCRIDGTHWRSLGNPDHGFQSARGLDASWDTEKLFEASDGSIVVGGRCATIRLIDQKTDKPKLLHGDQDMNHWVTGIAQDAQHHLWFSIFGVGVLRYDGEKLQETGGPWTSRTDVHDLCIDAAGSIWVLSDSLGVMALHADGSSEKFAADRFMGDFIEHLLLDRSGRVWVVSSEGLAVHPAGHVKDAHWQYARLNNIQFVSSLLNTSDGSWWIGGPGAVRESKLSLTSANPRLLEIEQFKQQIQKTYPKIRIDEHQTIGAGGVVVGVADKRLLRFDGRKWEDLGDRLGHPHVHVLYADSKGTVWVATSGEGLIGLDPGGAVRRYNNDLASAKSVIYCLVETPDGMLYAGTQQGVYRLRGQNWEHLDSDLFQVGQMVVDHRSRVWMLEVTYSKVYVYDGQRFREVKEQTDLANEPIEWGSLRLDGSGGVLVDVLAQPVRNLPRRTFRWDATGETIAAPKQVAISGTDATR